MAIIEECALSMNDLDMLSAHLRARFRQVEGESIEVWVERIKAMALKFIAWEEERKNNGLK